MQIPVLDQASRVATITESARLESLGKGTARSLGQERSIPAASVLPCTFTPCSGPNYEGRSGGCAGGRQSAPDRAAITPQQLQEISSCPPPFVFIAFCRPQPSGSIVPS